MLKFECVECENATAVIYQDEEGDLITECLECEDIRVVCTNKGITVQ